MKKDEVPQQAGLFDEWHKISYATDDSGNYVLVESEGDDAVNIANKQAWDVIHDRMDAIHQRVQQGEVSPLAFYMELHQMDESLLAQYTSFFKWQIKRHLRKDVFNKLSDKKLEKYAEVFDVEVAQLKVLPKIAKKKVDV